MSLTLDPALEARIQRLIDADRLKNPSAVLESALDVLEAPEAHSSQPQISPCPIHRGLIAMSGLPQPSTPPNPQRYNPSMSLTLNPALEARIQRLIDADRLKNPSAVIESALDVLEAQEAQEDWLLRNKDALNERLDESYAQAQRGELYTEDKALEILRERAASRAALPVTNSAA